jgi:hypothetical protein
MLIKKITTKKIVIYFNACLLSTSATARFAAVGG